MSEEILIDTLGEEHVCSICSREICIKDIIILDQKERISFLEEDFKIFSRSYNDIKKQLNNLLKEFPEKVGSEIEILNPISLDIMKKLNQLQDIIHVYIYRKDNLFDIIIIYKQTNYENKLEISKLITELMRFYETNFFDFIIFDENEMKSLQIEEDKYLKFK